MKEEEEKTKKIEGNQKQRQCGWNCTIKMKEEICYWQKRQNMSLAKQVEYVTGGLGENTGHFYECVITSYY